MRSFASQAASGGGGGIRPRSKQQPRRHRGFALSASTPNSDANNSAPSTSTSSSSLSSPSPPPPAQQYRYVDAQGKRKATIQDASPSLLASSSSSSAKTKAPWELGFQLAERNGALWNDDLRRRLIRQSLSSRFSGRKGEGVGGEGGGEGGGGEGGSPSGGLVLTESEIDERLAQLTRLLPGLAPRLASTSASILSQMVADPSAVAATLVALRSTFPGADIGRMVSRAPALALAGSGSGDGKTTTASGLGALAVAREKLLELLPNLDVDAAVSDHPSLLDYEGVSSALDEARRVLGPDKFERAAFEREPSLVFRFQHGDLLIPYDQFEKDADA